MVCRTSKLRNQALDLRPIQQSRDANMSTIEERLDVIEQRLDLMREMIADCVDINSEALTAIGKEVETFMELIGVGYSDSRQKTLN
jgi:archaellum component FlaC